jgi:hypothetical protein
MLMNCSRMKQSTLAMMNGSERHSKQTRRAHFWEK